MRLFLCGLFSSLCIARLIRPLFICRSLNGQASPLPPFLFRFAFDSATSATPRQTACMSEAIVVGVLGMLEERWNTQTGLGPKEKKADAGSRSFQASTHLGAGRREGSGRKWACACNVQPVNTSMAQMRKIAAVCFTLTVFRPKLALVLHYR